MYTVGVAEDYTIRRVKHDKGTDKRIMLLTHNLEFAAADHRCNRYAAIQRQTQH